jgi:hypothetical protein
MSKRMKQYAALLRQLHKVSESKRKSLLKHSCDKSFINCLSECAKNILKGNVPLSSSQKLNLRRRKQSLRKLSLKKTPLHRKKHIIQTGGFLGALLGPIISILGGILKQ